MWFMIAWTLDSKFNLVKYSEMYFLLRVIIKNAQQTCFFLSSCLGLLLWRGELRVEQ